MQPTRRTDYPCIAEALVVIRDPSLASEKLEVKALLCWNLRTDQGSHYWLVEPRSSGTFTVYDSLSGARPLTKSVAKQLYVVGLLIVDIDGPTPQLTCARLNAAVGKLKNFEKQQTTIQVAGRERRGKRRGRVAAEKCPSMLAKRSAVVTRIPVEMPRIKSSTWVEASLTRDKVLKVFVLSLLAKILILKKRLHPPLNSSHSFLLPPGPRMNARAARRCKPSMKTPAVGLNHLTPALLLVTLTWSRSQIAELLKEYPAKALLVLWLIE